MDSNIAEYILPKTDIFLQYLHIYTIHVKYLLPCKILYILFVHYTL